MLKSLFGLKSKTPINEINPAALQDLLQGDTQIHLIDVRSAKEYKHDGHVDGARLIPLPALSSHLDEIPADQPIYCICRTGARSRVACEQLTKAGYENVTNVQGGLFAWQRAGLPVV